MKLAKKVLATVMAVAMIFALSALAFAAGTPTVVIEAKKADAKTVALYVYLKDAIGLKSLDTEITYDAAVLEFSYDEEGADAAQVGQTKKNTWNSDYNAETAGLIKWSAYFKTELTDAATFANDAKKEGTVDINAENFEAIVFYFDIKDANAENTAFEVTVTNKDGVELVAGEKATVTLKEKQEEPEPSSAEQEEPSSSEAASEEGSKPVVPDTGDDDKNTDAQTWAIAAAAGVAALAGAAFIISKKRK